MDALLPSGLLHGHVKLGKKRSPLIAFFFLSTHGNLTNENKESNASGKQCIGALCQQLGSSGLKWHMLPFTVWFVT